MMIIRMLQLALLSALLVSCDKEGDVIVDPPPAKDDLLETSEELESSLSVAE